MYRKAARMAAVTTVAAATVAGGVALAPAASANSGGSTASGGYDHAPSWCKRWYIADGAFHCSVKFPAGQSYDYYSNTGYKGEQYVRQFHAKTGTTASASTSTGKVKVQATGKVKYWYQDPNGHWWWTSHKDRYERRLAQGWKGNGTNGPGSSVVSKSSKPKVRSQSAASGSRSSGSVSGGVWDRLAQCEAGGNWSINTGNGFYGGLQFTLSSWRAVGGSGYPHQASKAEQINRGQKLQAIQGWGAWPACSARLGLR